MLAGGGGDVDEAQHLLVGPGAGAGHGGDGLGADHGARQALSGHAGGGGAVDDGFAAAHDGDTVGIAEHVTQFVGDEDDGMAGLRELAGQAQGGFCLLLGQDRGGLVHNEDFGAREQDFHDFEFLAVGDGHFIDAAFSG